MLDQQFNMRKEHDTKGSRKKTMHFNIFATDFQLFHFVMQIVKSKLRS